MNHPTEKPAEISLGRLGHYLGFQLKRLQNELSRDFAGRIKEYDLRSGMFSMLELIRANPGISQVKLGQEIGMDKSAVGILVDDLEQRELVKRERSKQDRRHYELSVTAKGKKLLSQLFPHLENTEKAALAALQPEEMEAIAVILDKVYHIYVREMRQGR